MLDRELLIRFVQTRSEDAFAELVHRHMDAVYAAARRQVRDNQLAEDVAQAVFIVLARKASKLQDRDSIAGWLMKTTHLASLDAIKIESRRKRHEQRAAFLAESSMEQNMSPSSEISSELDRVLARLKEADRSAVTLRYLQGKSTSETAESLGISEPAAAKRITRAVNRLRKLLLGRRAITPIVALAVILEQMPRSAAPAALAGSVATAATSGAASAIGLCITRGVLNSMMVQKLIAGVLLFVAFAGIAGVGVGAAKLLADEKVSPDIPPAGGAAANADRPSVFRASLSNGVSIEIVGVSENPSTGKQWWLADGDLLATPPYLKSPGSPFGQIPPPEGYVNREFAVRIDNIVNGSADHATVGWDETNDRGSETTVVGDHRGRRLPGNSVAMLPDAPGGATIRAEVAAGKWETVWGAGVDGCSVQAVSNGGPDLLVISRSYSVLDETHVIIVCHGLPRCDMRVVAIGRTGNVITAREVTDANRGNDINEEFAVNTPLKSISQWQVQSRPFNQWMEIRGIALHAGQKTQVVTVTSDDQK